RHKSDGLRELRTLSVRNPRTGAPIGSAGTGGLSTAWTCVQLNAVADPLFGGVGDELGDGRVHHQALDEVGDLQVGGDRDRDHGDELGRVPADDGAAEHDAGGRVGEDLHEPARVVVD